MFIGNVHPDPLTCCVIGALSGILNHFTTGFLTKCAQLAH